MAQIHTGNPVQGGCSKHKIPSISSTVPRYVPCSIEEVPRAFLSPSMSKADSKSAYRHLSASIARAQTYISTDFNEPFLPGDDSNYVFGASQDANSVERPSEPNLVIRPRLFENLSASSVDASIPPSSGSGRSKSPKPFIPRPYATVSTEEVENKQFEAEAGNSSRVVSSKSQSKQLASKSTDKKCDNQGDLTSNANYSTDDQYSSEASLFDAAQNGTRVWVEDMDEFENRLLQIVGYDLELASSLMPQLYRTLCQEKSSAVGHWTVSFVQSSGQSGSPSQSNIYTHGAAEGSSDGKGKRRQSQQDGSDEDPDDASEGDDDREGDKGHPSKRLRTVSNTSEIRLACPFHKWRPDKYNAFDKPQKRGHPRYKTCQGRGFSTINYLKDHLESVHLDVQCITCAKVFSGTHESRANELEAHHIDPERCPLNKERIKLREGISQKEWVGIIRVIRNNAKRNPGAKEDLKSNKWMEIWTVLFPGLDKPDHPWAERPNTSSPSAIASSTAQFLSLVKQTSLRKGVSLDEQTLSFVNHAYQLNYTKEMLQRAVLPAAIPSDFGFDEAQDSLSIAISDESSGVTSQTFDAPQRVVPMMSSKRRDKQRATSSMENQVSQSSGYARPTSDDGVAASNIAGVVPSFDEALMASDHDELCFTNPGPGLSYADVLRHGRMAPPADENFQTTAGHLSHVGGYMLNAGSVEAANSAWMNGYQTGSSQQLQSSISPPCNANSYLHNTQFINNSAVGDYSTGNIAAPQTAALGIPTNAYHNVYHPINANGDDFPSLTPSGTNSSSLQHTKRTRGGA